MVLLEAWFELRKTLSERQLRAPLRGVYRAISDIGAAQRLGLGEGCPMSLAG